MRKTLTEFYRNLLEHDGWERVAPLLEVLPELEAQINQHGLHRFTSHEILRISPNAKNPVQDDLISIVPDKSGKARVFFQRKQDPDKVMVLFGDGGTLVEYANLASYLSPHFEKLAERKTG